MSSMQCFVCALLALSALAMSGCVGRREGTNRSGNYLEYVPGYGISRDIRNSDPYCYPLGDIRREQPIPVR